MKQHLSSLSTLRFLVFLVAISCWLGTSPEARDPVCGNDICEGPEDCSTCPRDCYGIVCYCGDLICEDCELPDGQYCTPCVVDCGECRDDWDCDYMNSCCGQGQEAECLSCCEEEDCWDWPYVYCIDGECIPWY